MVPIPHDFIRAVRYSYGGPLGAWLNKAEDILGPVLLVRIIAWPKGAKWPAWREPKQPKAKKKGHKAESPLWDQPSPVRDGADLPAGEVWYL